MSKISILLLMAFVSVNVHAQLNTGLVAHWAFNGTVADTTGNGHNGTPYNITYTTGRNGLPNTAALFNGSSSYITTPYVSDLNTTQFSICTIIQPTGFYTGTCQGNRILERGYEMTSGHYGLEFTDNMFNDCSVLDTTLVCFSPLLPATPADLQYSPSITLNTWYSVVLTCRNDTIKMYVNSVLKYTAVLTQSGLGTSADSLYIGARYEGITSAYPYWLKGAIDDLRLYNRALSQSDITTYHTLAVSNVTPEAFAVNAYPNPAGSTITVKGKVAVNKPVTIAISNVLGQVVYRDVKQPVNNVLDATIPAESLVPGLYIIRLCNGESTTALQVSVLH